MMTDDSKKTAQIASLLQRVRDLPALSVVVTELIASLNDDDIDLTHLIHIIEHDQTIVSQTLKLANSPFFGMRGKIGTVKEALTVIGFRGLRSLILASELRQRMSKAHVPAFDNERFWTHAHETAVAARALVKGSGAFSDKAFLAGLLHDLGKLAFLALATEDCRAIVDLCAREHCDWSVAEQMLDLTPHAELGAALARHWNFPEPLCAAIAAHHKPVDLGQELAIVVHVANVLACAMAGIADGQSMIPQLDPAAWRELAADPERLSRATRAIRAVQLKRSPGA